MVRRLTAPPPPSPGRGGGSAERFGRRCPPSSREGPPGWALCDRGSQTLEFALIVPAVVIVLLTVVELALVSVELVGVQVLAREAARVAAMGDDPAVHLHAEVGERRAEVVVEPADAKPGDAVTATVRLRTRLSDRVGVDVWLPGRATMRREPAP